MNVYQTASNFNHSTHYQHNLLISQNNSIYYGDDHFYTNIDNTNNSLIHMFIKNEQKLDQKTEFYPNSSFTFSSPSPSSSFNSSNGSGQMLNWHSSSSQTNQEESIVLCQLDELTKNLNNQMNEDKKIQKIMNQNLENMFYITPNVQSVQMECGIDHQQLQLTNYEFNSNSFIPQKLINKSINCLPQHQNESLIIQQHHQQQQFNTDLIQHQTSLQPSQQQLTIENSNHISHLHSLSNNSPVILTSSNTSNTIQTPSNTIKSSLSIKNSSSTIQSCYTPVLSTIQENDSMQNQTLLIPLNQQQQLSNQYQLNEKVKTEINSNNNLIVATTGSNHLLNAIIGYDAEGRPIRNTANKKERRRTLSINNAFSNLRDCIPNVPSDTKLSKIKTLRLATSYISYLMELLDDSSPINSKRNRLTCEDFKVDLQRFKGRSKSIHLIYPKLSVSI